MKRVDRVEQLRIVDLKDRAGEGVVRALVAEAVGFATEEKVAGVLSEYTAGRRRLVGFEDAGALVGVIGFEEDGGGAVVLHITVVAGRRRTGVGRAMVRWLAGEGYRVVQAETDVDAVGFYERCGFGVERVVDERFPDAERYRCILRL